MDLAETRDVHMQTEIQLRLTVVGAPTGVTFCVQKGKNERLSASRSTADEMSFDFGLRIGEPLADGRPRLLGPIAQGPPDARFVYVNSGTLAGQSESCWSRRAKVPLKSISAAMIAKLLRSPDSILQGRIAGTSKDGGPVCASVRLLEPGWEIVPAS